MPSVSAQDPVLEPARITKGIIIPLRMNRGDFFVSGASWVKFHALRPWASFEQFLASREVICDECNVNTIHFFEEFQSDLERHARILADCALRRETRRILNADGPYSSAQGLRESKPKPVDEGLITSDFMYHFIGQTMMSSS